MNVSKARLYWYNYIADNICNEDVIRILREAYMDWLEAELKKTEFSKIDELLEEMNRDEPNPDEQYDDAWVWSDIEDWMDDWLRENVEFD